MNYYGSDIALEKLSNITDLGANLDDKLSFKDHITDKTNKAYGVLGIIKRNFDNLSTDVFLMLYKSMVRSHLEYAGSLWNPYRKGDIKRLEKVQTRATKLVNSVKHLSYENRLKKLKLECGQMPNLMVALPNIGGALCSTPQSLADAHY